MRGPKVTRCVCGAADDTGHRHPIVRRYDPAPGRGDPAEHWASLGGYDVAERLYGWLTAWRLWFCAGLWTRDGAGSPWHVDYWHTWDRRRPAYLLQVQPPDIIAPPVETDHGQAS